MVQQQLLLNMIYFFSKLYYHIYKEIDEEICKAAFLTFKHYLLSFSGNASSLSLQWPYAIWSEKLWQRQYWTFQNQRWSTEDLVQGLENLIPWCKYRRCQFLGLKVLCRIGQLKMFGHVGIDSWFISEPANS